MTQASLSSYDDIKSYISQGLTIKSIAERAGMNELAARRLVLKLSPGYKGTVVDTTPYGMDKESVHHRVELGSLLYDLRMSLEGDRTAVARLVGLNIREQIRAEQRPFDHNWSISQMQRLAKATNQTFQELLHAISN